MEEGICQKLCVFEKELPTFFMDLQVHLLIHLVDDIELESIVSKRWMFFSYRYIKNLKVYVQKKAHPEGSMDEGYVLNEAYFFLCEFLGKDFEHGTHFWDEERASYIIYQEKP
jgi:hypothetical protein